MSMRPPAVGTKIDFHIPCPRRGSINLNHCAAEIRPRLVIFETGMKHAHGFAV